MAGNQGDPQGKASGTAGLSSELQGYKSQALLMSYTSKYSWRSDEQERSSRAFRGCVEVLAHIWGVNQMGWGAAPTARAKAKAAESEASSHRHILIH